MDFKTRLKLLNPLGQKGQAAVEYVLLIGAMAAIIFGLLGYMKDEIVAKQNPCPPAEKSLGCSLQRIVGTLGTSSADFRYFTLKR